MDSMLEPLSFDRGWLVASVILFALTYAIRLVDVPIANWCSQVTFQLALGAAAMAAAGRAGVGIALARLGWVPSRLTIGWQIGGVAVCLLVIAAIATILGSESPGLPIPPFENLWAGRASLFLSLVLFPAVVEELFFRGALQPLLTRRFDAPTAIVAASLLFAFFHSDAGPTAMAYAFGLGLCLGAMRHRCGSIREAMLVHGLNNAAYFLSQLR